MDHKKQYRYYIGIDTGVNTGLGAWNKTERRLERVEDIPIHKAMEIVKTWHRKGTTKNMLIRVEDARKRKWFGKNRSKSDAKQQGAGSVKRDAKIWEDFLTDLGIDFEMVDPMTNTTKLDAKLFTKITGWTGRTTSHGRDAAMLVFNF